MLPGILPPCRCRSNLWASATPGQLKNGAKRVTRNRFEARLAEPPRRRRPRAQEGNP